MTASERRRRNCTSMTTRSSCFKPFDLVYEEITQRIRQFAVNLTNKDEVTWLNILIVAFRHESDKWDTNGLLDAYRREVEHLHWRVLQLTAGAYLHVSYDLPRILATNWPGSDHLPAPNEQRGEIIYDQLSPEFRGAIASVCTRPEIVGIAGLPIGRISFVAAIAGHWIQNLRRAAWSHAHQMLACSSADREQLENVLLTAVTTSLTHTTRWAPWSFLYLYPPLLPDLNNRDRLYFAPPLPALATLSDDSVWRPMLLIIGIVLLLLLFVTQILHYLNAKRIRRISLLIEGLYNGA